MGTSVDENIFFFQFLCRRIRTHVLIVAGVQNRCMLILKKSYFFEIMFFLKHNFQDEIHLHANCLFCILILCRKCFSFQVFYCGIRKHISILIGAQAEKLWYISKKMLFLKFNFQDEDQLYANCLFHILSLYRKYFLFQLLIGYIHMHIHILTGVQTCRIISWKNSHFCGK